MITGYQMKGEWDSGASYKTGDIVRNRGFVYIAVQDSTNQQPDSLDPESRGYYDPGSTRSTEGAISMYWQLLITGTYYRGEWFSSQAYVLGDIVVHKSTAYKCIQAHAGEDSTLVTPDLDTTNSYWIKMVMGNPNNVLAYRGDLRTHTGSAHDRLAIGSPGQALKVVSGTGTWERLGEVAKVYYVAMNGKDDSGFGFPLTFTSSLAVIIFVVSEAWVFLDSSDSSSSDTPSSDGCSGRGTSHRLSIGCFTISQPLDTMKLRAITSWDGNKVASLRLF